MENILAAMDPTQTHLFAGIHALNLAERISARISFLLIFPSAAHPSNQPTRPNNTPGIARRIGALIQEARSDGITAEYHTACGNYETELVRFVQENRVTLLVVESAAGAHDPAGLDKQALDRLRHRLNCRIEVVNAKPKRPKRKE